MSSASAPQTAAGTVPAAGDFLNGRTQVYGLLGHPIAGSLSPIMQNAGFAALGLNAVYVPFPVQPGQLKAAVQGLVAAGVRGFNLTVPHKLAILPMLQEQDAAALAVGAVNTVRCTEGRLAGTNTDGAGFRLSLRHDLGWSAAGKTALLLGAGGAARSVAQVLLQDGAAALTIANRTLARAQELANRLAPHFPRQQVRAVPLQSLEAERPHLLVNATTVGMGDGQSPVPLERLGVREAVLDIVYHPAETPLLVQARELGLPHANGVGMLLYQGTAALEFWTGRPAPEQAMRQALLRGLAWREREEARTP